MIVGARANGARGRLPPPLLLATLPRLLLATLALGAAALPTRPAHALGCVQQPFETQVRAADIIFSGRAIRIDAELATTFAVDRVYKGSVADRVVVETGRVKYAMLSPPGRHLVLATLTGDVTTPGNLYHHQCSGSLRAPWPEDLQALLGEGVAPLPRGRPPRSGNDAAASDTSEVSPTTPPPPAATEPATVATAEPEPAPPKATPPTDPPATPPADPPVNLTPAQEAPPTIPERPHASCSLGGDPPLASLAALVLLSLPRRRRT